MSYKPPETATLRCSSNFSTSHETRKHQCHPLSALPPAYRQCQLETHSRSIPLPPIVPLPKPPAIGPRHLCPPLATKTIHPLRDLATSVPTPNPLHPLACALAPTQEPRRQPSPPSKSPVQPAHRPDCIPSRIGPRPPAKCAQCHPRRRPSRRGHWSPSLRVGCSTPSSRKAARRG